MKKVHWMIAAVAGLLVSVGLVLAQQAGAARLPKPDRAVPAADCATAGCHQNVKAYKVVHGPVNVDACDACHTLTDAAQHTYRPTRERAETCTFCHVVDVKGAAVVHKPLADGDCLGCHNPHGGNTARFLRGNTMAELCNSCHKDVIAGKKMVHGPVAGGSCESCHSSHTARFPKMLNSQGRELCLGCHTDMNAQMKRVKFTHKAVEADCMSCHDPHASNYTMQIKQAPLALCTSCHEHEDILKQATESRHKHSVVVQDDSCLSCHTAHGSDLAKLMRATPVKVCMKCHEKPQQTDDGRTVSPVPEVLDPKTVKHGPVRDGNCGGCHQVHGSNESRLLVKPYPQTFYQAFALEDYGLCFTCHDPQLVQTKTARGLTGFRNGDENLHFVHVNKPKGRNCRACHSTHASSNELHVRDTVPYGQWQMPIRFQRTASGGSCSPGCHKPYEYNRDAPVEYAPSAQSAAPRSPEQQRPESGAARPAPALASEVPRP